MFVAGSIETCLLSIWRDAGYVLSVYFFGFFDDGLEKMVTIKTGFQCRCLWLEDL